ncbi:hypothetical protein FA95DRAFT_1622629, partial [Auriscalpium vulgare]
TLKAQPIEFGAPQEPDFLGANALNEQVGIRGWTGGRPQGTKSIFVDDTADESGDGLSDIDLSAFDNADFLDFNDGFISENDDVYVSVPLTLCSGPPRAQSMLKRRTPRAWFMLKRRTPPAWSTLKMSSFGMVHVEEEDSWGMVHIEEEMKEKSPIKKTLAKTPVAKSIPAGPANSANTTSKVDRTMAIKHLLLKQKLIKQQLAKEKAMLARVREAKKGKKKAVAPAMCVLFFLL